LISVSGTAVVSVVPGVSVTVAGMTVQIQSIVPVTTQASVSVSGIPIWWSPTATVIVSGNVVATTTQAAVTGGIVWLAPTQTIFVTISGLVPVTTQTSVSVSGLPVWFQNGALVGISGIVPVTTAASVSVTGMPVWLNPTQSQTVAISAGLVSTTQPPSGVTGVMVWPGTPQYVPFLMIVTSTVGLPAGTTYLMTIWTGGTNAGAGLTQYQVPAGKNLRIVNMQFAAASATNVATIQAWLVAATASASFTSGSLATVGRPLLLQMQLSSAVVAYSSAAILNAVCDIPAGTTIGIFMTMGTSVSQIGNVILNGYLF